MRVGLVNDMNLNRVDARDQPIRAGTAHAAAVEQAQSPSALTNECGNDHLARHFDLLHLENGNTWLMPLGRANHSHHSDRADHSFRSDLTNWRGYRGTVVSALERPEDP